MPLESAHVFASHIGHTGKTTLAFQMSCYCAKRDPEKMVMLLDLSEEGDVTKRMLGGVDAANEKIAEIFGGVFRLLDDADGKTKGMTSWLWSRDLKLEEHAVQVCKHNPAVPKNLFLISSGAWPRDEPPMEDAHRKRLCQKIKEAFQNSEETWKILCDTDGDRRPSEFTKIGYSLCSYAIVPLHLNKADLDRTETMLGVMNYMRKQGEIDTQVLFIVWNFVKVLKDEPTVYNGMNLSFTPTKVCLDILDACNKRLLAIKADLPGLFAHDEAADEDFLKASVTVLRNLADNVLKPSEEQGLPFVEIVDRLNASGKKSMKFQTGGVEYTAADSVIRNTDEALQQIESKFEAMSLSGPGAGAAGAGRGVGRGGRGVGRGGY